MKHLKVPIGILFTLILFISCSSPEGSAEKELQAQGIDVTTDSLISQVKEGNLNTVKLLLEAGVPVDSTGVTGNTALEMATISGQIEMLNALLAAGAEKDRKNKHGDTAFISAVRSGKTETALALLKAGATATIEDNNGKSALDIAIEEKNWSLIKALGEAGVNLDEQDEGGRTMLMDAIYNLDENSELAEVLIAAGADVNIADNSGETPFTVAVNQNLFELATLMVQHGADVNTVHFKYKTYSPLMFAIENKRVELIKTLIEAGADVNFVVEESQNSCLYAAVSQKQKDIVLMLIKAGANVNTQNNFRNTPLSRVTIDPVGLDFEIAQILIQAGADINAVVSDDGYTALHVAVLQSEAIPDSLQFLLEHGAATDTYDNNGQTPLTLAVLKNKPEAVKALIEAGADVDHPAMTGEKPLYTAEKLEHKKIARMLRTAGAAKK